MIICLILLIGAATRAVPSAGIHTGISVARLRVTVARWHVGCSFAQSGDDNVHLAGGLTHEATEAGFATVAQGAKV
ncbi:hypothetical protein E2562_038681 [Oryza meyeriana var. granulata]|uniref:Secreted protein n=1 Tax=Oryza meyeriana var. granulata TaxID=110450 RepID=A0A6G1CM52_9ORYZ|nr:hypothetical protein E2562_038681 [Oryza meyeriana var. granulata]